MSTADSRSDSPTDDVRRIEKAPIESVARTLRDVQSGGRRAWMVLAACVARLQNESDRGDQVLAKLAAEFHLHRSRIARLGRIYREALGPRLRQGDIILTEQAWYEIACEAAGTLGQSVETLLAHAEARKLADPRYSTRKWKEELGLKSTDGKTRLSKLLVRLVGIEDDVLEEFTSSRTDERRDLLSAATDVLARAQGRGKPGGPLLARARRCTTTDQLILEWISEDGARALGRAMDDIVGRPVTEIAWDPAMVGETIDRLRAGEGLEGMPWVWQRGQLETVGANGEKVGFAADYVLQYRPDGSLDSVDILLVEPESEGPAEPDEPIVEAELGPQERWVLDTAGNTTSVTAGIAAHLGETVDSMIGASLFEFLADPELARSGWEDFMAAPFQAQHLESASARANGASIVRRDTRAPVPLVLEPSFLGRPGGALEGLLLCPSLPFATTTSASPPEEPEAPKDLLGSWIIDAYGRTVYVSRQIAGRLGCTVEEMVGESAISFSPEPGRTSLNFRAMRLGIAPDVPPSTNRGHMRFSARDGRAIELKLKWVQHQAPSGAFLGVTLASPELFLDDPDDRPPNAPHLLRDCVWIVTVPSMVTEFVSPEIEQLLGHERGSMVGQDALAFIPVPFEADATVRNMVHGRELQGLEGLTVTQTLVRKDGSTVDLTYVGEVLCDRDGAPQKIIARFPAG